MRLISLSLIAILHACPALAQHNHSQFHDTYMNWVNGKDKGCCDNRDCGQLAEADEKTTPLGVQVRIEGQWCRVEPWHYLIKGNAPNWSSAHICVQPNSPESPTPPCSRLLCYQPKPLF